MEQRILAVPFKGKIHYVNAEKIVKDPNKFSKLTMYLIDKFNPSENSEEMRSIIESLTSLDSFINEYISSLPFGDKKRFLIQLLDDIVKMSKMDKMSYTQYIYFMYLFKLLNRHENFDKLLMEYDEDNYVENKNSILRYVSLFSKEIAGYPYLFIPPLIKPNLQDYLTYDITGKSSIERISILDKFSGVNGYLKTQLIKQIGLYLDLLIKQYISMRSNMPYSLRILSDVFEIPARVILAVNIMGKDPKYSIMNTPVYSLGYVSSSIDSPSILSKINADDVVESSKKHLEKIRSKKLSDIIEIMCRYLNDMDKCKLFTLYGLLVQPDAYLLSTVYSNHVKGLELSTSKQITALLYVYSKYFKHKGAELSRFFDSIKKFGEVLFGKYTVENVEVNNKYSKITVYLDDGIVGFSLRFDLMPDGNLRVMANYFTDERRGDKNFMRKMRLLIPNEQIAERIKKLINDIVYLSPLKVYNPKYRLNTTRGMLGLRARFTVLRTSTFDQFKDSMKEIYEKLILPLKEKDEEMYKIFSEAYSHIIKQYESIAEGGAGSFKQFEDMIPEILFFTTMLILANYSYEAKNYVDKLVLSKTESREAIREMLNILFENSN